MILNTVSPEGAQSIIWTFKEITPDEEEARAKMPKQESNTKTESIYANAGNSRSFR